MLFINYPEPPHLITDVAAFSSSAVVIPCIWCEEINYLNVAVYWY